MTQFILTPPVVLKKDLGYSLIKVGDMEMPESLVINMCGWSALDLLSHWRSEIGKLVNDERNRCCVVSGLTKDNQNKIIPSEWWIIVSSRNEARFQYQVLLGHNDDLFHQKGSPDRWWEKLPEQTAISKETTVSEWTTTKSELKSWCNQIDVLINAIQTIESEESP